MSNISELSPEAARFLQIGRLIDATGFNGDDNQFDIVDFVEAASDVIPPHSDTEEYRTYIQSALASECRELQLKGYREDSVASYLLGSVMWRISASEDAGLTIEDTKNVLARTVHSIALSRESFGRGDEKLFHFAFANYTQSFGDDYEPGKRRKLRHLSRFIEHQTYSAKREVMPVIERQRRSMWYHVLNGMATIAMKDGYLIQPPEDQRDENGAWQLPHERDEEDDA